VVNRTRLPRCLWIYTSRGCLERGKDSAVFCIAAPTQPALTVAPASSRSPCGSPHIIENKNPRCSERPREHSMFRPMVTASHTPRVHRRAASTTRAVDAVIDWRMRDLLDRATHSNSGSSLCAGTPGPRCALIALHTAGMLNSSAATLPAPTGCAANTKRAPEAIVCTRLPPWKKSVGAEFRYGAHPDTAPFRRRRNSPSAADIPAYRAWSASLS
jgi:hypothetical protein